MNNLQNDYTAAKTWATSHLVLALVIGAAAGLLIGLLVG